MLTVSAHTKARIFRMIRFLERYRTITAILLVSVSLLFTFTYIKASQKTQLPQVHAQVQVELTPPPTMTPSPPMTPKPTSTPTPSMKPTQTPIPSPTLTPKPTENVPISGSNIPAKLLNLSMWKLQLPTGPSEHPTEIPPSQLSSFVQDPWFMVNKGGVQFRAPVNAVTTKGSNYPRSELREMNGEDRARWSSTVGTHTMTVDQAITATPLKKPHVVAGQIHDGSDDVIVIRLEGSTLYVNVDGDNAHVLDSSYTLGKRFTVKFEASGGQTKIYYNGSSEPAYTLSKDYSGAYFKAGAYTQSNCSKEDVCSDSNYGEVVIYSLSLSHT